MTYAFVQDTAASWEHYQRFVAGLSDPVPQGLIVHLAGPTDEGFRVIAVWDSEHDFKRFQAEHLEPVIAALGGRSSPALTFRDLHPAVTVGPWLPGHPRAATATWQAARPTYARSNFGCMPNWRRCGGHVRRLSSRWPAGQRPEQPDLTCQIRFCHESTYAPNGAGQQLAAFMADIWREYLDAANTGLIEYARRLRPAVSRRDL